MSLLHLPLGRTRHSSARRRPKAFRPSLHPSLEGLEERTVMSAATAAMVAAAPMQSPITITGAQLTNVLVKDANNLLATFSLTGTLNNKSGGHQAFTLPNLQVPVTLAPTTTAPDGVCPVLHLSLQIPDLNVLGLHVRLDNCNNGPVNLDITAIPGGGLLGDLLCGLNKIGSPINLTTLNSLTDPVTGGNALNALLGGILGGIAGGGSAGGGSGGASSEAIPAGDCELVDLHVGAINLDALGLNVATTPICLNVYADPNGGLLGNLLCSVDNLLNNHGNNAQAVNVLIGNILRDLGQLV